MQVRQVPVIEPKKPEPPKTKPVAHADSVKPDASAQVWPVYSGPGNGYYGPWGYPPGYRTPTGYWTYQPGPPPQPANTIVATDKPAATTTTKLADTTETDSPKPTKALTKEEEIGQLAGKWITQFLQKNPEMVDAIPPDILKALKTGNITPDKLQELFTQLVMQKNGLGSLGTGLQNNWVTNNWVSRKFVMPWAKWGVRQMMPPGTGGLSDKLFDTVMKPSPN